MINGRIEHVASRTEFSFPIQIVGLILGEVRSAQGQRSDLCYDIDQDGQEDLISCSYWERWGVLNCIADISGSSGELELQCQRVIISPSVFGPKRSHRLLCDEISIDY